MLQGLGASAVFSLLMTATAPAVESQPVDPDAAEALLRAELASVDRASVVCVSVDGLPLAGDAAERLRRSGILTAPDRDTCQSRIAIGDFAYRPELGTYEVRFTSQLFGGSSIAVMKHFTDGPARGWHVVTTYHVGVWL